MRFGLRTCCATLGLALLVLQPSAAAGWGEPAAGRDGVPRAVPSTEKALRVYLDQRERRFEAIAVAHGRATWRYFDTADSTELDEVLSRWRRLVLDERLLDTIAFWGNHASRLRDPVLRRRVNVWRNVLTWARVELSDEVQAHSGPLIRWLASGQGAEPTPPRAKIEERMLELMSARNRMAARLGFHDFGALVLDVDGTGAAWLDSLVDSLLESTEERYRLAVRRVAGAECDPDVATLSRIAWQYEKKLKRLGAERKDPDHAIREVMGRIGLDVGRRPITLVEREMPRGFGGNGFPVRIPGDFRIVINKAIGLPFYYRLHEIGHGLHRTSTRVAPPVLKGYEWCLGADSPAWAEGMAETVAGFSVVGPSQDEDGPSGSSGAGPETVDERAVVWLRVKIARALFERELYRNPEKTVDDVWSSIVRRILGAARPEPGSMAIDSLAWVTYPVYEQNYFLADIVSWQVHEALRERFGAGYATDPRVGGFLVERCWAPGASRGWRELLTRATGKDLDVDGYLASTILGPSRGRSR